MKCGREQAEVNVSLSENPRIRLKLSHVYIMYLFVKDVSLSENPRIRLKLHEFYGGFYAVELSH